MTLGKSLGLSEPHQQQEPKCSYVAGTTSCHAHGAGAGSVSRAQESLSRLRPAPAGRVSHSGRHSVWFHVHTRTSRRGSLGLSQAQAPCRARSQGTEWHPRLRSRCPIPWPPASAFPAWEPRLGSCDATKCLGPRNFVQGPPPACFNHRPSSSKQNLNKISCSTLMPKTENPNHWVLRHHL